MATAESLQGSLAESYMSSILEQQNPIEITKNDIETTDGTDTVFLQLLQVDSWFNLGRTEDAKASLAAIKLTEQQKKHDAFHKGLKALVVDTDLSQAYSFFVEASHPATGLEAVFYSERAVNIAFWMACSGNMLQAAHTLTSVVTKVPYAAGVLSFAMYMNHDNSSSNSSSSIQQAEQIARQAMAQGFQDPWTLHAVAHCLYAQGKSKECAIFLDQHRKVIQQSRPSAFMKGHMEFHQALCYIDMEDGNALHSLIEGPLWNDLTESERQDYWNAAGLLNVQWKAELRGIAVHPSSIAEAIAILMPSASVSKSSVFSVCILRWSTRDFRIEWKEGLLKSENAVLRDLAHAVDLVYPSACDNNELPSFSSEGCIQAVDTYLAPNVDRLDQLGASPEQREVVEEFLAIAGKVAGEGKLPISTIDMSSWTKRNCRPNVNFYESILGLNNI